MNKVRGFGTVYKTRDRRKKPWRVQVVLGYHDNGSAIRATIGYFKSKNEGMLALLEYHKNPKSVIGTPTLNQLYELFIPTLKEKSISTLKMYQSSWKYLDDLKNEKITDIKSIHIQDTIDYLIDELGLGYSTVHKVRLLSSQLYQMAMQDDYVNKDYSKFVKLPKKPKPDNRIFDTDEVSKLEKFARENDWAKIIIIMIYTATRPNELLKLSKFEVNFKDEYLIAGSKTEAGTNRYIPIHPRVISYLEHFIRTSKNEYVFEMGESHVQYRYFLDKYYEVLENLEITLLSPHKCRKTGATIFKNSGMDPSDLQKILGHQDYNTTIKYYIGDDNQRLQTAMRLVK